MKRKASMAAVLSLAVLCPLPLASASAPLEFSADINLSTRVADSGGKVGKDHMKSLWEREFAPDAVPFTLVATCTRSHNGVLLGSNKILYKEILMRGVDSGNRLSVGKSKIKLKQGMAKKNLAWDVTDEIQDLFSEDSIVEISATVIWKKRVGAGDGLACNLNILEGDDGSAL